MFPHHWSVDKIPSMQGQVVIVTGGNSGLGLEAVRVYATKGATVILACRSLDKGYEAAHHILAMFPQANIDVMKLDLASLQSVHTFCEQFKMKYNKLDILMNNAGVMTTPYGKTEDGFEQQLGINHLGHFALTSLLFDHLKKGDHARIVNISSNAHKQGDLDFDNLMYEGGKGYSPMKAYSRSKLANLLFTFELQRRIEQAGLDIKVLAAHPGGANTNLARHIENKFLFKMLRGVLERITQSAYDGALPGIRAATDRDAKGGQYYGPSGKWEMKGDPVLVEPKTRALDVNDADLLWKESERLTGVPFTV
ncbi:short-chain dehydrogenase [Pontibacillus chungwhensis BH030062]|uniref:Short-chain dehydrogenase n=1 Tax=Pontibacillus chungwhensis BH030062 TaxID=1385513 RepID=A0A0A2UTN8_9BACI|nr:oxidoreductase [Pontibacillus chungwhensis]KGP91284.1 short-chain dehydrogenase [Pontibacillus chungwhensis BH030062]